MLVCGGAPDFMKALRTTAAALGLVPDPAGTAPDSAVKWFSWYRSDAPEQNQYGPQVRPIEPPLDRYVREFDADKKRLSFPVCSAMALGRRIEVSNETSYKAVMAGLQYLSFSHPYHVDPDTYGLTPAVWLAKHLHDTVEDPYKDTIKITSDLGPANGNFQSGVSPVTQDRALARMQVAALIAGNEGALDSCQAGDFAHVSFGMQQWGAHNNENLPVLWERYRAIYPDKFDLFFGMWGLGTQRWLADVNVSQVKRSEIDKVNHFGADPSTLDPMKTAAENECVYFPSHATFVVFPAGKARKVLTGGNRRSFFLQTDNGRAWCARARLAALCSPDYLRIQLHTAAWRMTPLQCYMDDSCALQPFTFRVPVDGKQRKFTLPQLFSSWCAAALALDQNVNAPGCQPIDIRTAIAKTGAKLKAADINATTNAPVIGCAWYQKFMNNYIGCRRMTDAQKRSNTILAVPAVPGDTGDPSRYPDPMSLTLSPDFPGW